MDKKQIQDIELGGALKTERFAADIGSRLVGGEVIELISDLGGGKTTFVKGLVAGAGSKDHVTSPSFTLRNDYKTPKLSIAHFDFYRLNDPGILKEMLSEAMLDQNSVVVIEWANVVQDILPIDHIQVSIKTMNETRRTVQLTYSNRFGYLFGGLN